MELDLCSKNVIALVQDRDIHVSFFFPNRAGGAYSRKGEPIEFFRHCCENFPRWNRRKPTSHTWEAHKNIISHYDQVWQPGSANLDAETLIGRAYNWTNALAAQKSYASLGHA